MDWDREVDVVCTSTGAAGLAKAISVVDRGGEVFVASPGADAATVVGQAAGAWDAVPVHPRLGEIVSDFETIEYFAALSCDLDDRGWPDREVALPIRVAHEWVSLGHGGAVPPFVGSRLRDWAADCLASPSGYLFTRISGWESATLQSRDGDSIEVAEIGSMTSHRDDVGGSVYDWLTWEARHRQIEPHPNCSLQRLVFVDGDPVGAIFMTSSGPLAIKARYGLLIATGDTQIAASARQQLKAGNINLRVALVGHATSRFGRLELLSSGPIVDRAASARRRQGRLLNVGEM